MDIRERRGLTGWIIILCLGIVISWGMLTEARGEEENLGDGRIVIESSSLEMDNSKKTVTFTGDVKAKQNDFSIECQEMVVFYKGENSKKETSVGGGNRIEKIVATGQVIINRGEGGTARSEKAVYYDPEQKLVLTGDPVARQGNDSVEGEKITIFLKERRSIVESSGGGKVKAVINPQSKEE